MKKLLLFLFTAASFAIAVSCSTQSFGGHKQPKNLIPEDTMVEMIAEQLVYESTLDFVKQEIEREDTNLYQQVNRLVGGENITIDSLHMGSMHLLAKLSSAYYAQWLKQRGYTYEQFEQSLIYYFNTSQSTEEIMSKVKKRIMQKYGENIPLPTPDPSMPN